VDLPERNRDPDRFGERYETEEVPARGSVLEDPEHGGARDLNLLALGTSPLGVGEGGQHALREVQQQDVPFPSGRWRYIRCFVLH
jgi:hypothetical protein